MIEAGKAKGQIRADISTALAAAVFSTILEQIDLMILPTMDDEAVLAKVDELTRVLKGGWPPVERWVFRRGPSDGTARP